MLNIDEIQNGIVIDHIKAGTAIGLMDLLGIKGNRTASVALIQNARSHKASSRTARPSRKKSPSPPSVWSTSCGARTPAASPPSRKSATRSSS